MSNKYNVAIVGATGMVGGEFIRVLEQRKFPVKNIRLLASGRSKGKTLKFCGKSHKVEVLGKDSFKDIDIALFSAGGSISKEFAPIAVKAGAIVVDNSSAWRMDPKVPLVVPEVNPHAIKRHKGIIANPNCSTIQMVVALKPLHDVAKIKRIVVATYQSVSGWGKEAVDQLWEETKEAVKSNKRQATSDKIKKIKKVLPAQIAFNVIPHIDVFLPNNYTKEEMKMLNETRKIMEDDSINVTATCVRVGVVTSHAEAVNIETERKLSADEARDILRKSPGVEVIDDVSNSKYPLPIDAAGKDACYVGRVRADKSVKYGLNLWVVSDNLRKGAALNAVQIAELLIK
ncbi:MAG: aspartate-semialdehyde dehydrogenase [Candidatus Omnitrophica bacterium]|nr:aspartate-semialdehyde dehydrogenase [Candidatus Omnitrophota bacterium]MBU4457825.1 aspartate-semialdehyde dehydrogenase [Candidatus Omnitrophota bacterium]